MKHYIICQRNNLYIENDKIHHNGKEIEYEGDIENAVEHKKIEIYRNFLSKYFENTIVLTGAGSSYGIGKTDIKGMTMRSLWEKIVEQCEIKPLENLAKKINYRVDDIKDVNLEDFCHMPVCF